MFRHFIALLIALGLFCAAPLTASANDASWSKVKDRGELIVGFAAHYPPFDSKNEKTGEFEGFDVDMAKALADELGVGVKFVDAEWQGLLGGLNKGDFDMLITCMSKSEGRGKNVTFSDVYYRLADVMVMPKGADALCARMNQALTDIRANGKYDTAVQRWLTVN